MAEWFKAHAWKVCVLLKVPWVRIPLSPPIKMKKFVEVFFHLFFKLKKIEKPKSKAQIFINFFWDSKYKKQIIDSIPKGKFKKPAGLIARKINLETGELAKPEDKKVKFELFLN